MSFLKKLNISNILQKSVSAASTIGSITQIAGNLLKNDKIANFGSKIVLGGNVAGSTINEAESLLRNAKQAFKIERSGQTSMLIRQKLAKRLGITQPLLADVTMWGAIKGAGIAHAKRISRTFATKAGGIVYEKGSAFLGRASKTTSVRNAAQEAVSAVPVIKTLLSSFSQILKDRVQLRRSQRQALIASLLPTINSKASDMTFQVRLMWELGSEDDDIFPDGSHSLESHLLEVADTLDTLAGSVNEQIVSSWVMEECVETTNETVVTPTISEVEVTDLDAALGDEEVMGKNELVRIEVEGDGFLDMSPVIPPITDNATGVSHFCHTVTLDVATRTAIYTDMKSWCDAIDWSFKGYGCSIACGGEEVRIFRRGESEISCVHASTISDDDPNNSKCIASAGNLMGLLTIAFLPNIYIRREYRNPTKKDQVMNLGCQIRQNVVGQNVRILDDISLSALVNAITVVQDSGSTNEEKIQAVLLNTTLVQADNPTLSEVMIGDDDLIDLEQEAEDTKTDFDVIGGSAMNGTIIF